MASASYRSDIVSEERGSKYKILFIASREAGGGGLSASKYSLVSSAITPAALCLCYLQIGRS